MNDATNTARHDNLTGRTVFVRGTPFTVGEELSRSRSNCGGKMLESVRYVAIPTTNRIPVRSRGTIRNACTDDVTIYACEDGSVFAARSYDWIINSDDCRIA